MDPAPLAPASAPCVVVGRYAIYDEIAAGGMATVHLGKLVGAGGFSRLVAIKRLHPNFAKDSEFSAMFMDEARLAARIHHPNVVQTLDVVTAGKELLLVMEYVHGMSLAALLAAAQRAGQRVDPRVAAGVIAGVLEGLHAAHEARSEAGAPLGVVHRDVSPQNILVGVEGVSRILDFGVAKAIGKMHATRDGQLKGKLAYMSPEQVRAQDVTRQSDVFSTATVLWEAFAGERLFKGTNPAELIWQVISDPIPAPRTRSPDLPEALDQVVMKALSRDLAGRYATAREMAEGLEAAVGLASPREIARWVEALAGDTLATRRELLSRVEQTTAEEAPEPHRAAVSASVPERASPGPAAYEQTWPQAPKSASPAPRKVPLAAPPLPPRPVSTAAPPSTPPPPPPRPVQAPAAFGDAMAPIAPEPPLREGPRRDPRANASGLGGLADGLLQPPHDAGRSRPPVRPHRIPLRAGATPEVDHASLRERLETPLKVVALGAAISLIDVAVRQVTVSLPIRPLWIAEALVVAGVLWALARVVLPTSRG